MDQRFKTFLSLVVAVVMTASAYGQDKKEKKVKDQGEYDIFTAVTKETDPAKKVALIATWKEKYPESDYKVDRLLIQLTTYQQMGQAAKMADTAKEILAIEPDNVTALYWLTLLTESLPPTPDNLATGEKAAKGLLAAKKPDAVKEEDWKNLKTEVIAHKTLGFIANARKDYPTAEKHYVKVLELNPAFAQVSYALGLVILQQVAQNPDRQSEVLFHVARAASLTGVGELPADQRKAVEAFFTKNYNKMHGSADGMQEVRDKAKASALPPAGFKIVTFAEIEAKKQEELAKANPQLALWLNLKSQLTAANGTTYFDSELKGSDVPKLKGTIISTKPAARPKEIVLGIEKADVPEVTLVLETAMAGKADPGTVIEFKGVPSAFSKEPFNVTFDVEGKDQISGWPAAAPTPKKSGGAKKTGAAKKK